MQLDRKLIKSQARELIKGKVFILFLIIFVVGLLCGGISGFFSSFQNIFNGGNPFEQFQNSDAGAVNTTYTTGFSFGGIFTLVFAPLSISLAGMFLLFIRGTQFDLAGEFNYVFKNTFDKNYMQKFLLQLLVGLFTVLWSILFLIPGLIYHYKTYFVDYIMADNPDLTWQECIALSKKMTNNHKGELFVFDLSFFLWYMLMGVTCGIAGIYVLPYIITSQALYYENFKLRGLQNGEISEYDFMSTSEKIAQAGGMQNNAYQANPNMYQPPVQQAAPQQPQYQAPVQQPVQPQYQPPVQQPVQPQYQPPVQQPQEPQFYQPPVQAPAEPAPQPEQFTAPQEPIAEQQPAGESFYTPPADTQQYFTPNDTNTPNE